jgi:hypothetical protein
MAVVRPNISSKNSESSADFSLGSINTSLLIFYENTNGTVYTVGPPPDFLRFIHQFIITLEATR